MNKLKTIKILLCFCLCFLSFSVFAQEGRRVKILATGGTIAGAAKTATQASYIPGVLGVDEIIKSVSSLREDVKIKGIQISNIASQNIIVEDWVRLHNVIDSLFSNDLTDGIVITHGTDTMEETAFFLNLTLKHSNPVVLVGAMRAATSLSADGNINLYNAVTLASSKKAYNKGVMVVMNNTVFSADDVSKMDTRAVDAFTSPNVGPLALISGDEISFLRESLYPHTINSEFDIKGITDFPQVEILYSYAFSSIEPIRALVKSQVDGIIIAGVGHGNYSSLVAAEIEAALEKGITVVRSSRILSGGVNESAEGYSERVPVSYFNTPQEARILLMLTLLKIKDCEETQRILKKY